METLKNIWWILLLEGLALIIMGIICLIKPFSATIAFPFALSIILVIAGIIQFVRSFALREDAKLFTVSIFSSLLSIFVGVLTYKFQWQSIPAITCLMIAYLCFDGFAKIFLSSFVYYLKSWPFIMISGFLNLALGLLLMMTFPISSFYTIGLFLGMSMLCFGIALLAAGFELKTFNWI